MLYIGIDPGLKGGLSVLNEMETPILSISLEHFGKELDTCQLSATLEKFAGNARCMVEESQIYSGQGAKSMATFLKNYGKLVAVLEILHIPYIEIHPRKWMKKVFGTGKIAKGESKRLALEFVRKNFPEADIVPPGCKRPHSGIVDSLCIAYCLKHF